MALFGAVVATVSTEVDTFEGDGAGVTSAS